MRAPLLIFSSLLLLTLIAGTAVAVELIIPPSAVVVETTRTFGDSEQSSLFNLTFELSPQDPNQTVGEFRYTLRYDGLNKTQNVTRDPVPGRPGWVYHTSQSTNFQNTVCPAPPCRQYVVDIVVHDATTNTTSTPSCSFTYVFHVNNSHNQCGTTIGPPSGVAALVLSTPPSNPDDPDAGTTQVKWRISADDSGTDFEYWFAAAPDSGIIEQDGDYNVSRSNITAIYLTEAGSVETFIRPVISDRCARTACQPWENSAPIVVGSTYFQSVRDDAVVGGYGTKDFIPSGSRETWYFRVQARDNLTHQRSEYSCTVSADRTKLFYATNCGNIDALTGGFVTDGPTFPMIDIPAVALASGISEGVVIALVASGFILALCMLALKLAGGPGAVAAGVIGFGFITALGLFPLWGLVLIFFAAVVIIVFARGTGGGTGA